MTPEPLTRPYSCRELAQLAGVSVRTLHHYDRIGLLKPTGRTEARYRSYGPAELLRLQQILFYKELDFSLAETRALLEDPAFDLLDALRRQRSALAARQARLTTLLATLDRTLDHLTGKQTMPTYEDLYAGFPKETAAAYRREIGAKYGPEVIEASEQALLQLSPTDYEALKQELQAVSAGLLGHCQQSAPPAADAVQRLVARHFAAIKAFWGPAVQPENHLAAYRGLAQLYLDDPRYTSSGGQAAPGFAAFLAAAMRRFVDGQPAG